MKDAFNRKLKATCLSCFGLVLLSSLVSTLDEMSADVATRKKKKTVETSCMWILIITAAGPNGR